jgi:hypothetical protein
VSLYAVSQAVEQTDQIHLSVQWSISELVVVPDYTLPFQIVCIYRVIEKSLRLMITIQKITSNVQSVPRQSPDIY